MGGHRLSLPCPRSFVGNLSNDSRKLSAPPVIVIVTEHRAPQRAGGCRASGPLMRFYGSRRARGIILALSLVTLLGVLHVARLYGLEAARRLVPTVLAYIQEKYHREVAVDRIEYTKPGEVVVEGLRVARGPSFKDGNLLIARRVRLTYDPYIITWSALASKAAGWKTNVGFEASGLRIWKPAPKKYEEIGSVGRIATVVDIAPLLQRKSPDELIARIGRVDVSVPHVRVRRTVDGTWSLEDLKDLIPEDKDKKPSPMRGEVRIVGATVDVEDHVPGRLRAPVRNRLLADVTLQFAAQPTVHFTARGGTAGVGRTAFTATGRFETKKREWFVSTNADAANLPDWLLYLAPPLKGPASKARLMSGSAAVTAVAWGTLAPEANDKLQIANVKGAAVQPIPRPRFNATLTLRDAAVKVAELPGTVRLPALVVTATPEAATVDGSVEVAGIPVRLSGEATPLSALERGSAPLRLTARLTSEAIGFAAVKRLLALPAVKKAAPDFKLPAGLQVPRPVSVSVDLAGTVQPRAEEPAKTLQLTFKGTAGVPSVWYSEPETMRASARGGRLTFEGRYDEVGGPVVKGTLDAGMVRYRDEKRPEVAVDAADVHADLAFRDKLAQVEGRFGALGGSVNAKGWVDLTNEEPEFYVTGSADGIDAARVPLPKQEEPLQVGGTASAEFIVSGTAKAPVASAFFRASAIRVKSKTIDERVAEVSGRVRYANKVLELAQVTINDPRLQAAVSGTVSEEGALKLEVGAEGVDLAKVLEGRLKEPVQGSAFVSASISGTTKEPRAEGRVQVYQPAFREYAGDYLQARFVAEGMDLVKLMDVEALHAPERLTADLITLTHAKDEVPASVCQAGDKMEKDPLAGWSVEGKLSAEGLSVVRAARLAKVSMEQLKKVPLMGDLAPVQVSVRGPAATPILDFKTTGKEWAVGGFDVGAVAVSGSVDLAKNRVDLTSVTTDSSFVQTSVSGSIGFNPKATPEKFSHECKLDLKFSTNNVKLLPLLRQYAPNVLQQVDFRGTLKSVDGTVTGTAHAPKTAMQIALADLRVNQRVVSAEPLKLTFEPGVLNVAGLNLSVGQGRITGFATVVLNEEKTLENILNWLAGYVKVENLPVRVVRQLLEDGPFYQTEPARPLREALSQWRSPIGGEISGSVRLTGGGPGGPALPDLPGIPNVPRGKQNPRLEGEMDIAGLASPPGPDQKESTVASRFSYEGGRFDLTKLEMKLWDGSTLTASGHQQEKADGPPVMQFGYQVKDFKLSSIAAVPIPALRKSLAQLRPLDGTLKVDGALTGTTEAPKATFAAAVDRPVLLGVPVDQITLTGGRYTAAGDSGEVQVDRVEVVKKRRDGGPDATLSATEILVPVKLKPGFEVPLNAERRLTINIPAKGSSALSVPITFFNDLAAETADYARGGGEEAADQVQPIISALKLIGATKGELDADVTLAGTFAKPDNSGHIGFRDGVFKVQGLETAIDNFSAYLKFEGDAVDLTRFEGRSSVKNGGFLKADGTAKLARTEEGKLTAAIDGDLEITKFRFVQKKVGAVVEALKGADVRGMIETVDPEDPSKPAPLRLTGVWPRAEVHGAIKLDEANLKLNVQEMPPAKPAPPAPYQVALDVRLFVGDKVTIGNSAVSGMRLTGSLRAENTLQYPQVAGELRVSKGVVRLPMRLRDVSGTVKIAYDARPQAIGVITTPPINIDVQGHTILREQRSVSGEAEIYDATVTVRGNPAPEANTGEPVVNITDNLDRGLAFGSARGLQITIETEPRLPPNRIMALVRQQFGLEGVGGSESNVASTFQSQVEQALAANVGSELTARIEDFIQSKLGLTTFSIDLGVQQSTRVRMGRKLYGPLFGSLTQQFGGMYGQRGGDGGNQGTQQRWELYYQFNPQLRVGYRRTLGDIQNEKLRDLIFFSGSWSF